MRLVGHTLNTQAKKTDGVRTLAVDIGGTGTKLQVLDARGKAITDRSRVATPKNATPSRLIGIIDQVARVLGPFDRVSVGFPGVTKGGIIFTAPNLGPGWEHFPLGSRLERKLGRPVRVANDADVQGLASVKGKGVELVITLGTGCGSVVFTDGHRLHLELGHHPFRKGKTYEDELGNRALRKRGKKRWSKRLREAIVELRNAFRFDHLFIGGGNAKFIAFKLPKDVSIVSNERGLLGGIKLWTERG